MFVQRLMPIPTKNKRVWLSLLIALTVLFVLGTSLVARASSAGAMIKIAPAATLANPPTAVIVTVTYSCLPSQFGFGSVSVDQSQAATGASGSRIDVFGFGNFQPVCDDKAHRADVVVSAFGGTFITGTAGASAFVASGVVFANTQIELNIK